MKNGYDGAGIPIHRSGPLPKEPDAGSGPEVYSARGVPVKRTDLTNTDLGEGQRKTVDGARAVSIARGGW